MVTPPPAEVEFIVSACLMVVTAVLGITAARHRHHLASIPIRIHVNGTRGKSSVTRLIAAGFRAAGYRTIAKTTGTAARLILEDETEYDLERASAACIREQFDVVRHASERHAEVLVIECMAIKPEFQLASQESIVQGTCSVVTNVRPDHQEEMGETLEEIGWSMAAVAPQGGILVTAEENPKLVAMLERRAARVGGRVVCSDVTCAPTNEDFGRVEFAENIALALKVCELHGIGREVALEGMRNAAPDPGVMQTTHMEVEGTKLCFVNAFAANDYDSTEKIINDVREQVNGGGLYLVVSCRADRPRRTVAMAKLLGNGSNLSGAFVIGDGGELLQRLVKRQGLDLPVCALSDHDPERMLSEIGLNVKDGAHVVGVGNIAGSAQALCDRVTQGALLS
ncbi:MAG: poly-gamma-glutamate synthase PgsB [Armatimonadota bacterium]